MSLGIKEFMTFKITNSSIHQFINYLARGYLQQE
jgi:hypothetical protein